MPHFVKTFLKMRFVPSEEFYSALSHIPPLSSLGIQVLLRPGLGWGMERGREGNLGKCECVRANAGRLILPGKYVFHCWALPPCQAPKIQCRFCHVYIRKRFF